MDGRQGTSYGIMWGGMNTDTDKEADDTTSTSITDFLTRLNYSGIFGSKFGAMRGSWYYVGNTQYNTGVGTLEMAGTAVLNMSAYANTSADYKTLLFLEGSTGNMYSYVSQRPGTARWSRYAKTTDNVASATKLATARQINGTNFDGTANITTSKWGTARTLSLTGAVTGSVSIDGSGNVSLATTYAASNISALDSRYVNVSGDTMTGKLTLQRYASEELLTLNNTNTTWGTLIRLYSSGALKSTIGWSADHGSYIQGSSTSANPYACVRDDSLYWNDSSKFWHAGNDGSGSGLDADLLDGYHGSNYLRSFWTNNPGYDANTYPTNSFCTFTYSRNAPYTGVLAYLGANGYGIYLNLAYNTDTSTGQIAYRKVSPSNDGGGLGAWAYLARTTDNVASATQLQTARTLWGRSFNGTANVSGSMTGVGSITMSGSIITGSSFTIGKSGAYTLLIQSGGSTILNSNDGHNLQFGYRGTNKIVFCGGVTSGNDEGTYFGAWDTTGLGIGTTSPSYKLHVVGTGYFSGITTDNYIYTNTGWFQNNKSACGLYNSAVDARWYANGSGWISDKKINANAGLAVTGAATFSSTITASGLISTTGVQSVGASSYGVSYRAYNASHTSIEICGGNYVMGLGCHSNGSWHWWRGTSGYASSSGKSYVMSYNGSTWSFTGALTATTTIFATTGIYSNGYVSAKGNNSSSDIRLKNILCPIRPSLEAFAKAPLFRFAWKSNPDMVEIGSSAQYWRNVLPDTVKERDGWLEMGYGNIALAGVITIAREMETLEQRVDRLEKENNKLKDKIKELERRAA